MDQTKIRHIFFKAIRKFALNVVEMYKLRTFDLKGCRYKQEQLNWKKMDISRGFLLCQLWIAKYYIKSLSNDLSNENVNTGVSREMIFQK